VRVSVRVTDAKANGKGPSFAFVRVPVAVDLDVDIVTPFGGSTRSLMRVLAGGLGCTVPPAPPEPA